MKLKFLIYKKRPDGVSLCGEYLTLKEARKKIKHLVATSDYEEIVVLKTLLYVPNYLIACAVSVAVASVLWYLL